MSYAVARKESTGVVRQLNTAIPIMYYLEKVITNEDVKNGLLRISLN